MKLSLEARVSQKVREITDRKIALEQRDRIDNLTWQFASGLVAGARELAKVVEEWIAEHYNENGVNG